MKYKYVKYRSMKCNLRNPSMSDNLRDLLHPKLSTSYMAVYCMNVLLECFQCQHPVNAIYQQVVSS